MANPSLNRAFAAYGTASGAVPPLAAVIRLYEKGLSHLGRARIELQNRRYESFAREIDKVMTIASGLDSLLDMKRGRDVALDLHRFYANIIGLSGAIAARKDPVPFIDRVISMWSLMLDAWRSVAAERAGAAMQSGGFGQRTACIQDREIEEPCTRSISILG
jgi:flagellar secretion chaperone FliS